MNNKIEILIKTARLSMQNGASLDIIIKDIASYSGSMYDAFLIITAANILRDMDRITVPSIKIPIKKEKNDSK